ncbi:hypothetical protein AFLA_009725 [Aspergillus flavus NRRL3357]|nr:uncharacterized protein G4B84_008755 [Aspergillus flavus NRRL3357]KAF7616227.1 hypothetical protein AFLA_009725 [Aspergillus flavus NRRL3357]KAJ1712933.1 hypothetical protein NYO67_4885 [Aspergillus flavus]QMW33324.1 hypothetical protein G4B84_008755 [Aspergillus flavus NRRL3357]QMW45362.1 hypothetical protein G4B11_008782 [Aspergillus flavus]
MPFRLPAPLFNFEWPLDSPKLASPPSTRKRRSNSSPEAPQRSTEAIFNEIIHKIPTIREFTELVYEYIPPEQGSLICRTFLESGIFEASNARANFNARTGTLWIRVRLTELHGVQIRWVGYTSGVWVRKGLMNEAESDIFDIGAGTTLDGFTGQYTHSSKEPDLFLCPATDDLPSIVVESGFSESWPRLHADKDLWMYGSTTVNVVILLKWSKCVRTRCKGKVEVWTRNPAGGLMMCEKPIFPRPVPAPDPDTDVVQFTKLDLFGKHIVAGQNPMTVLSLGLSELRDHARHRMSLMGLTPA